MRQLKAIPVEIEWNEDLPVFALEPFLKAVGDEYGWIGGVDDAGRRICILPYTVVRSHGVGMVRFRVETIPLVEDFDIAEEREFLALALDVLRKTGAAVIIPATTNTIFRTYPVGAAAAPYGSYVIDLRQDEASLWQGIERITRQNINTARKRGVEILSGMEYVDEAYELIHTTFERSRLPFMKREPFLRYVEGLGRHGKIVAAMHERKMQSCVVFASSRYCTYAVYGGNLSGQVQGSNKLLHWEAMRLYRSSGSFRYDFVGARISPRVGSKAEAINSFKRHLGGRLRQGYMWKYPLRPLESAVYAFGVRLLRGGDIVDQERRKQGAAANPEKVTSR